MSSVLLHLGQGTRETMPRPSTYLVWLLKVAPQRHVLADGGTCHSWTSRWARSWRPSEGVSFGEVFDVERQDALAVWAIGACRQVLFEVQVGRRVLVAR